VTFCFILSLPHLQTLKNDGEPKKNLNGKLAFFIPYSLPANQDDTVIVNKSQ